MRDLHASLLGAVLDGEGLQGLTELAAVQAGGPVAIVLPARGLTVSSPVDVQVEGAVAEVEVPIVAGGERVGSVLVLASLNGAKPEVDREEVARAAALAALAELAVVDARDEVEHDLRASLIEDLRSGDVDGANATTRAARLGCELSRGAVGLAAEIESRKPRGAAALIEGEWPGSLAELIDDRVYAVLPANGAEGAPAAALARARKLVTRLRTHGPAAISSFYGDPGGMHQAIREAELVLEVVRRDGRLAEQIEAGAGGGVHPLPFPGLLLD